MTTERNVSRGPKPEPAPNPDAALREAIKAALDAGDIARVRALVDVLDPSKSQRAPVLELLARR